MGWFSELFGQGENRARNNDRQEAGRKLDAAMPPAGAGGELSGSKPDSETETELKDAARRAR